MATSQKTFMDDTESYRALVEAMPEPDRSEYKSYEAVRLEAVFPGRKLIVYTLMAGKPSDIEVISFGDLTVDWDNGPACKVHDARGDTQILTIPKRLRPRELFIQIAQKFELKYRGRTGVKTGVDFVSHYAVLLKTRSKESLQIDGHTHCVALNFFRERFPELKNKF